jgi:hypothetical protein
MHDLNGLCQIVYMAKNKNAEPGNQSTKKVKVSNTAEIVHQETHPEPTKVREEHEVRMFVNMCRPTDLTRVGKCTRRDSHRGAGIS